MNLEKDTLPDNSDELKEIIFTIQHDYKTLEQNFNTTRIDLQQKLEKTESNYRILQEKYKAAMRRFFSPSKEKVSFENSGQLSLFNEAEVYTDGKIEDDESDDYKDNTSIKEISVGPYTRKAGGKRHIPDNIPAEEITYELNDEEKSCKCCGKHRPIIGEDRSEELDIIPPQIKKLVHIVKKYGPCSCDEFLNSGESEVIRAVKPERFIPYSMVSPGLLAYCIDYKYNYAMPYYRLSRNFDALGIDISRATLCNWTMLASEKCGILYDLMLDSIRKSDIINMDETRIQVLKEDGKTPESLSYMWVMKSGNKNLTIFHYEKNRSSDVPVKLLKGFNGYLQTDGYEGYSKAVIEYKLVHVGCLGHIRRKFFDAYKSNKSSKTAKAGILFISRIYSIESKLRRKNLPPEDFVKKRKDEMTPFLNEFKVWLDEKAKTVLPQSENGKAVSYAINQWDKFIRFLELHDLTPDNNSVENAIRPFAVGRKNWLFSNTPRGAKSSAVMYSLVESAKNNNLNVYNYLRYLFTNLPEAKSPDEIERLLPCNLKNHDILI